jgi:predicted amidophosphoribosyltransferase
MNTATIIGSFEQDAANGQIGATRAGWEIEQCVTADLNLCLSCAHELRTGDKFCRRCGARQDYITDPVNSAELATRYKTAPLPQLGAYRRVSGPLVAQLAADISARAAQVNNCLLRHLVLAIIVLPLWLLIILLSPLDAYATAKAIAGQGYSG